MKGFPRYFPIIVALCVLAFMGSAIGRSFNAGDRARYVRFAIDDVALVHDDGRNTGDAQAPGIGDTLVCPSKLLLQRHAT